MKVPEGTVDKEKLKALVAIYKEIQNAGQGDYTDESWKAFSDELANAEALLEKSDATQAEIDEAYSKLETAYTNLTSTKNTEKLDELIAECSKLDKGDYTDESWNALQEALKAAKEIADKPNATQAEIDKAEQDLRDAYNALKIPEGTIDKRKVKGSYCSLRRNSQQRTGQLYSRKLECVYTCTRGSESYSGKGRCNAARS